MPRAASKEIEPVEMTAMGTMASLLPSRMIEPFPNCFSIWARARSIALVFSSTMFFSHVAQDPEGKMFRPHLSVLIEDFLADCRDYTWQWQAKKRGKFV